jgi:hypothetical protein
MPIRAATITRGSLIESNISFSMSFIWKGFITFGPRYKEIKKIEMEIIIRRDIFILDMWSPPRLIEYLPANFAF